MSEKCPACGIELIRGDMISPKYDKTELLCVNPDCSIISVRFESVKSEDDEVLENARKMIEQLEKMPAEYVGGE